MSKKSRSEGNRVAMAIKANKTPYYIDDVDLDDEIEDVFASANSIRKILGKLTTGFLLISAGVKNLIIISDVPNGKEITSNDWLTASLNGIDEKMIQNKIFETNDTITKTIITIDTPFKLKDLIRSSAFAYLRKNKLLEEESEDELFDFEY